MDDKPQNRFAEKVSTMSAADYYDYASFRALGASLASMLVERFPDDEILRTNLETFDQELKEARRKIPQNEAIPQDTSTQLEQSDLQRAIEFSDEYRSSICFVAERGIFLVYDGRRWKPDKGDISVRRKAQEFIDTLTLAEIEIEDYKARGVYHQSVIKPWLKLPTRKAAIEDAKPLLARSVSDFDADPYLLNVANCTLRLDPNTGTAQEFPHEPERYITRIADVEYCPSCRSERWEQFIREITAGDRSSASYLQKALGYALVGDVREEVFFILWGRTARNGKTTLLEAVRGVLSEYAASCDPASLTSRENYDGSRPREDVARLAGVRFVTVSEPPKNMQLDAATVKNWTGGDSIPARFLHENSFEFIPQFCLFLNTNHLPNVSDQTVFASDRLRVIPFTKHFAEGERDKTLKRQFATSEVKSAILNWLLDGYAMYVADGLEPPDSVKEVTEKFERDSDKIAQFFDECFTPNPNGEIRTVDAYKMYQEWTEQNGYRQTSQKTFKSDVEVHAEIVKKRPKDGGGATQLLIGFDFKEDCKDKPPF